MKNIVEKVDDLIIDYRLQLINIKLTNRPMATLIHAYILSIYQKQLTQNETNQLINNIHITCDQWADMMEKDLANEGPHCTTEWEITAICQIYLLAENFISPEKMNRWQKWAIAYCEAQTTRPFYYTGYNHEILRCVAMHFCGQTFNRPDFKEYALHFCKQLLNYATPFGFWEEGPHHGTSMRYNYFSIQGLSWMYRFTGDKSIKLAAENITNFMCTYAYPDGSTAGPLDGRQSSTYSHHMFMTPGLELTEKGQALFDRHSQEYFKIIDKDSNWELLGNYFVISAVTYYKTFKINTPNNFPLPLDQDNTIESHHNLHEGIIQRKGNWVCCLSGHVGQIPKEGPNIYRLERQSRIELWHKELKFVIGGGHNKTDSQTPYANFFINSGFQKHDFHFGEMLGTVKQANHAMYFVRAAKTFLLDHIPHISLYFAHATVTFSIYIISNHKVTINWHIDQKGAKKIAVQIPIIIPKNSDLYIDNKKIDCVYLGQKNLNKGVEVEVRTNSHKLFKIKTNNQIGIRYPHLPLITYVADEKDFFDKVGYYIAILSHQIDNPASEMAGSWEIEL